MKKSPLNKRKKEQKKNVKPSKISDERFYHNPSIIGEKSWITFFLGTIVACIIILSILPKLSNRVKEIIELYGWIVIIISLVFLIITIYKEGFFKYIFGASKVDFNDMLETSESIYRNIKKNDVESGVQDVKYLLSSASRWYSWKNYRKWVLGLFSALFIAFASLFGSILLYNQNILLQNQNEKIDIQNKKIDIQNNLIEAERRGSLVFLMANILDKVDEEIKAIQNEKKNKVNHSNYQEYSLSEPLINRIVALSKSLKPYRMLGGNSSLSDRFSSPERGQLFNAVLANNLDKKTKRSILEKSDFTYAMIGKMDFRGQYLGRLDFSYANFHKSNFDDADISSCIFTNADLTAVSMRNTRADKTFFNKVIFHHENSLMNVMINFFNTNFYDATFIECILLNHDFGSTIFTSSSIYSCDFSGARFIMSNLSESVIDNTNFSEVDFSGADFSNAVLTKCNFTKAKISFNSLIKAKKLFDCKGLQPILVENIRKHKPCLLAKEGCK